MEQKQRDTLELSGHVTKWTLDQEPYRVICGRIGMGIPVFLPYQSILLHFRQHLSPFYLWSFQLRSCSPA